MSEYSEAFKQRLHDPTALATVRLFELTIVDPISGDPPVERYAEAQEDILFHDTLLFLGFDVRIPEWRTGTVEKPAKITAIVPNTDQHVDSLLERHWINQLAQPNWTVKIWVVMPDDPNQTPLDLFETYRVSECQPLPTQATFTLLPRYFNQARQSPGRLFAPNSGFPFLP